MILYHFTNIRWLKLIVNDGVIKTTASTIAGPSRAETPDKQTWLRYRHRGYTIETEPQVVWLTDGHKPDPSYLGMVDGRRGVPVAVHLLPAEYRKTRVRITVSVPDSDTFWWPQYARRHKISEHWYHMLNGDPKTWFVVPRPIPMEEVIKIEIDDSQVWPAEEKQSRMDAVKSWFHK